MRFAILLLAVLALAVGVVAPPAARSGPDDFDPEKAFYQAYFEQHELGQPEMALVNYLKFLRADTKHPYATMAANFCYGILEPVPGKHLDEFMNAYGHLVEFEEEEPEEAPPEIPAEPVVWKPTTPEELLLERYRRVAASGKRPVEVAQAERRLQLVPDLWRDGDFIEGTRIATRSYRLIAIYRIAEMLERKDRELDPLRKRLEVSRGFGDGADSLVLLRELEDRERAIQKARTEAGISYQVARLYPDAMTSPNRYGFLALLVGLPDPMDMHFRSWPNRAREWLREQAIRPQMSEESARIAVLAGQELELIDALIRSKKAEKAKEEVRRLWAIITN